MKLIMKNKRDHHWDHMSQLNKNESGCFKIILMIVAISIATITLITSEVESMLQIMHPQQTRSETG